MKIGPIDTEQEVLIVAEIGNNHEGSDAFAEELIGLAAETGVQAVKFQTFRTEYFVSPGDGDRFRRLKSFELAQASFRRLADVAKKAGLLFLSTPLDLDSACFLRDLVCAYKIASGDNNFDPLLEYVASTGKPIILSSGLADIAQLRRAKALVERTWREKNIDQEMAILHCVTGYPVPKDQVNLGAVHHIAASLGGTVGYSDHTLGIEAAVLAVALGARIIEKHFTKDKNHSDFRDHRMSADPEEMKRLVGRIREAAEMLGSGIKEPREMEKEVLTAVRRSIAAKHDLPAGSVIRWQDLTWTRPAVGLPPGCEQDLLGRKLKSPVRAGEAIQPDWLV